MSHFTRIRTQLKNLGTVRKALEELGYRVEQGSARGFAGNQAEVDLVVRMKNGYDIGFRQDEDNITLVADFWGVAVDRKTFMDQLAQRYAYETIMEQAQGDGWSQVVKETQADGSIRLVMQRW